MTGTPLPHDADALARACTEAMWPDDKACQALDMAIEQVAAGQATVSMLVRAEMSNGHGTCHGGYIFTLADAAFAYACNSYDERTVAAHCSITYARPAHKGDRLTARAIERMRAGRSGIYDVAVTDQTGKLIAEFRGHSRSIGGSITGSGGKQA